MSYKIQSEYQYFYDVTAELLDDKLAMLVRKLAGHRCPSLSDPRSNINQLHPAENEVLAMLLQKCEHFSNRVGRAISKTQEEVIEEWSAVHHLVEGDGSHQNTTNNSGATTTTTTSSVGYTLPSLSNKNKKVVQSTLADIPTKLFQLAELKYKLLQCETLMKNAGSVSQINSTSMKDFEEQFPDYMTRCRQALEATLNGAMFDPTWESCDAKKKFKEVLGEEKSTVRDDVKLTIFTSLLIETTKALIEHLEKRRKILRRSSSGSSLNSMNSNSTNNSGSLPASPSHHQHQHQATTTTTTSSRAAVASSPLLDSNTNSHYHHQQQQQGQGQEILAPPSLSPPSVSHSNNNSSDHNHLYSSAFLPPYNPSMTEAQVTEIMTQFYTVHAPEYLASVPYIVQEHRNDFAELFRSVAAKYPGSSSSSSSSSSHHHQAQSHQQPSTSSSIPQVSSQPKLSEEENEKFKPSAEPDKTLDEEYYSDGGGGDQGGSSQQQEQQKVEVVNVTVDSQTRQAVVGRGNNTSDDGNNGNVASSSSSSTTATDASGSNCVVQ